MPFQPGQSGNPAGRGKDKLIRQQMIAEMNDRAKGKDVKGMRRMVRKVWNLAEEGERWAVEFVRDTIDGKPAQQLTHSGDEDKPLELVFRIGGDGANNS